MTKNYQNVKSWLKSALTICLISTIHSTIAAPIDGVKLLKNNIFLVEKISGKVTDANGNALPGVTVIVKNSTKGAVTGVDGTFTLDVNGNETLVFSFIGYDSQEISIAGKNNINVVLKENAAALSEIIVTGSRSGGRTVTDSPVPVDVISAKELKGFSQVDVGQILNYVAPSFSSNRQTVSDGSDHIDPATLRGLTQVLILVNGKRRHMSSLVNINGSVGRGSVPTDLSAIPVAAIDHIEVLRDGAAAQYGSDAIAGVINIVLKNTPGLSASVTTGENITNMKYTSPNINGTVDQNSQKIKDGSVFQLDLAKGLKLGKKGQMTVSGQFLNRGNTNRSGYDNSPMIYLGGTGTAVGFPASVSTVAARQALIADDATLAKQRGYDRHNMIIGNSSQTNASVFANGSFNLNKSSEVYFTAGYTYKTGKAYGNNRLPVVRAQQPLNADGTLLYPDGFLPGIQTDITDKSLIAGYRTKMNSGWNLDVSNTIGANSFAFTIFNSGNASLTNGQTKFDAGKLKFLQNTANIDLSKSLGQRSGFRNINLAAGAEVRAENFQIVAGEPNSYNPISGTPISVPLPPISLTGASIGKTTALPGSQVFPGYQPSNVVNKSRLSQSLYADVELDKGIVLVDFAGRFEHYSDFGSTVNGKVSTRIKLTDDFALRGAASTGFRAPTLQERYFNNTSTQFVNGNPSNTLTVNNDNSIAREIIGVDALKPEKSVNLSVGLTGKIARSLSFTIDAYQIKINDRIVYSGAYSAAQLGLTDASYNNQYAGISNVKFFANAANTSTKGIDIVVTEKLKVAKGNLTLTAALNFNETKVTSINGSTKIDLAANNNPANNPSSWFRTQLFDRNQVALLESYLPKNKINLTANYAIGKWNFNIRTVRFGEVSYVNATDPNAKKADGTYWNTLYYHGADGKSDNTIVDQKFAPVWITDLVVSYKVSKSTTLTAGSTNIFDRYPQQINIDPRNAYGTTDYNASRDASSRGRFLFQPNQGGYNGRYVFARINFVL